MMGQPIVRCDRIICDGLRPCTTPRGVEDLRIVIGLDAQSLSGVDRPETLLQLMQDIVVHGITSSEIGSVFD